MKRIGEKLKDVKYNIRPSAYIIIERKEDNKIAIATDGVYFFLGGGIENDETDEETVRREVIEEAGYSITDIKYFDNISSYCWSEKNGYMDIVATIYTGKFDKKVAVPIEEDHKVIWVNPEEYKDKLYHEYQRYILNKYISTKKGIYSE